MKKMNVLWIILDSIFLIIFNAMFFVIGGADHKVSVWISYGFIYFAYFMLLLTPVLTRKSKSEKIFGLLIRRISGYYFRLELLVGIIFILIASDGYKFALLFQLIIAGTYGIILIINLIANEHTADAEETQKNEIDYVKRASADLKSILKTVNDKKAKKKIEIAYDAVYSSPVKSHPNLMQTESQILDFVDKLKNTASSGDNDRVIDAVDALLILVNERNQELKMLN